MRNKRLLIWEIIGIIFILGIGTILHDLYKNTQIPILSVISPVNESYFEHWKIVVYPFIFYTLIEYYFIGENLNDFINIKIRSLFIFLIITFLPLFLYELLIGEASLPIHLTTYTLGAIIAQLYSYNMLKNATSKTDTDPFLIFALVVLLFFMTVFTYIPPKCDYFLDHIDNTYGYFKEKPYNQ